MSNINQTKASLFRKLETISNVVSSKIEFLNVEEVPDIKELMELFKMNLLELSLLSVIATRCPNVKEMNEVNLISLFNKGQISRSDVILSLKKLKRKNIIVQDESHRSNSYMVDMSYSQLLENDDYEAIKSLNEEGVLPFLKLISKALNYDDNGVHDYFGRWEERENSEFLYLSAVSENANLTCVKLAKKFLGDNCPPYMHQLFYLTIARRVLLDESTSPAEFLSSQKVTVWNRKGFINNLIANGTWWPIEQGIFEINGNHFMDSHIDIQLTDKGLQELCPELSSEILEGLLDGNTVTVPHKKPESITELGLIFDSNTQRLLQPIQKSMDPEIRQKIAEKFGHRKMGLTTLFYGYPGTGKTEFSYQLAKEFNLPVYEVNVAQIQDKWVGESEKNARKIFREYFKLRKQTKKECIMLFNEADALFGRRMEVNTSVDNMNNALKNIFLEELERFEGILLATTNLTGNLDPAFERRFLFKVFFNKPDLETQVKIWQMYFTELDDSTAKEVALQFDFSPGEISNVQIRYEIERILGNDLPILELISNLCRDEKIKSPGSQYGKKVGFN